MYFASRPIIRTRKGVSEIMGALLLIIVVIVAVASLAAFVAEAQKTAQTRQSFLTSVADENLQIVNAEFQANSTSRGLFPHNPLYWNNVTLTIRNTNTEPSVLNQVKIGGGWASKWNQINDGVLVLNQTSKHPLFYGSQGRSGLPSGQMAISGMAIPARGTESIFVAFNGTYNYVPFVVGGGGFLRNESISVTLLTQLGNFFPTVYNPPTAVEQVGLTTVNYQYFNRDVVSLDGSVSKPSNQSQIISYNWGIEVPIIGAAGAGDCNSTAFTTTKDYKTVTLNGVTTRFFQEAFGNGALNPLSSYCLSGPFEIKLSVLDSLGFIGNSSSVDVPIDPNMAPVATISAVPTPSPAACSGFTVTVTVENVFGLPVPNVAVVATASGSITPVPITMPATSAIGATTTPSPLTCSGQSGVTFTVGSLPSVTVPAS